MSDKAIFITFIVLMVLLTALRLIAAAVRLKK